MAVTDEHNWLYILKYSSVSSVFHQLIVFVFFFMEFPSESYAWRSLQGF